MRLLILVVLSLFCCGQAKIYDRCELAKELINRFGFDRGTIAHWICLVEHESSYNTAAKGGPNSDGSYDHGLFQINDRYWCAPPDDINECGVRCEELRSDDIAASVKCAKKIFRIHSFEAWNAWKNRCRNANTSKYIEGCNL
ncbi:lysozyme-like [Centruroides sculpturatus]|uniref:lysozyme-like n=1 Tax=Centruroides sculpturatus TaxID=218467 RepID=UPI000C6C952E|nr:lysozyme-like [Centruroides sculpturatus]